MWRFVRIHGGTVFCGARKLFYLFILQVFLNATKTASIVAHYSGIVPRPPVACPKMVYRGIKVNFKDGVKHFTGSNIVLFTLLSSLYLPSHSGRLLHCPPCTKLRLLRWTGMPVA